MSKKVDEKVDEKQGSNNQNQTQLKFGEMKGKNQKKLKGLQQFQNQQDVEIFSLKFCPYDQLLAAGCSDGTVKIYSVNENKLKYNNNGFIIDQGSPMTSLRWRPNKHISTKQVLVSVNADGTIIHWHAQSGKMLHKMCEPDHSIMCMDYNMDGSRLATAGKDFHVRIYDEDIKQVVIDFGGADWNQPGHANRVFGVKFVHDNPNLLLSSGWDSNLHIWDMRAAQSVGSLYGPSISGDSLDYKDGQILTGSYRTKDQLQLWDLGMRKLINNIKWDSKSSDLYYIYTCQFNKNPGNKDIIVGSTGINEVKIFDSKNSYQPCASIFEQKLGIYTVDYGNKSDIFAFGGGEGLIHIVDIKDQ